MAEVDDGVHVYRYNSDFLPLNLRNILSPFSFLSKEAYDSVLLKLRTETGATPFLQLRHIQDRPLNQEVANCAWKSVESSLFAVRLLTLLESLFSEGRTKRKIIPRLCSLRMEDVKCKNLENENAEEFIEAQGAKAVPGLLKSHRDFVEKIKEIVLENYFSYRRSLSEKIQHEIPIDFDFMTKIRNQIQKLRDFYSELGSVVY